MKEMSKMQKAWWVAAAILLGFFIFRGGGAAAIGPLLKFLVPVAIGYVVIRKIKRMFLPIAEIAKEFEKQASNARAAGSGSEGPVIEICPKCGNEKNSSGQCQCSQ